jgi:four helix bundle protein
MYDTFESMPVWQKGMELAERIFAITEGLPRKEDYGLTSQIRRSAVSVPGNIAEGFGRRHTKASLTSTTCHAVHWPKQRVI